ncbi:hypothetical protein LXL04_005622 [Taraxacum kok-saghyz]
MEVPIKRNRMFGIKVLRSKCGTMKTSCVPVQYGGTQIIRGEHYTVRFDGCCKVNKNSWMLVPLSTWSIVITWMIFLSSQILEQIHHQYWNKWVKLDFQNYGSNSASILDQYWNKWVPKKHNIFVWRLSKYRIPTRRKLNDMGMDIPCTLCPLCGDFEEDSTHLFFECSKTVRGWQKLGAWWSVDVPILKNAEDLLNWSWFTQSNEKSRLKFQAATTAVLVSIWRTRNGVVFENKKVEAELDFRIIQKFTFFWLVRNIPKTLHQYPAQMVD